MEWLDGELDILVSCNFNGVKNEAHPPSLKEQLDKVQDTGGFIYLFIL